MALAIGVSQPTVQRWLKGKTIPNADEISKLSDLFNMTADELLGRRPVVYSELNMAGVKMNDAPSKKEISQLTKIADNIADQLAELRSAIADLEK